MKISPIHFRAHKHFPLHHGNKQQSIQMLHFYIAVLVTAAPLSWIFENLQVQVSQLLGPGLYPRASERRLLPIVGVCISSSHLHTFSLTPSHLHIFSSSHLLIFTSAHLHICSSSHLLIFTSAHFHICSSSHLLIFTSAHFHICSSSHLLIFTSSHLHICSSSHLLIFSSSHLLIFTSSHLHTFSSSECFYGPHPSSSP